MRHGWRGRGASGSGIPRKNADSINIYQDKLKIRPGIRIGSKWRNSYARFHFQLCYENLARFSSSQNWVFHVWLASIFKGLCPLQTEEWVSKGVFIAERHFLSVWVYSLLSVYRAPAAHEAAQPAMCYAWPWGGGGIGGGMVLQA